MTSGNQSGFPTRLKSETIYTILSGSRSSRHQFLIGKFLGGLATVFVNILLMGVLLIVGFFLKFHKLDLELLEGVVMTFFQMMLVNALALMFSVFLTPFVNFFLTFAVFIMGSMSSITESLGQSNEKRSVIVQYLFEGIHFLIPNFANFTIQNKLIHPEVVVRSMAGYMGQNIVYAIIYSMIMVLIAILIFDRREV